MAYGLTITGDNITYARRIAQRYVKATDVDDVVQETMLRMWQARVPAPARWAWIKVTIQRVAIDLARRRRCRGESVVVADHHATVRSPEGVVEARSLLSKLFSMLSPIRRSALTLFVLGYSKKEMAARMDVNPNTAAVRLHAARTAIRLQFGAA